MDAAQAAHPKHFTDALGWVLSLDRASIHTCADADLEGKGVVEGKNLIWNPPRSGDLHQAIEHAHGNRVRWYTALLRNEPKPLSVEQHKRKCRELFFEKVTAEMIETDVRGLKALYRSVIKKGGSWGPNKQRWVLN